MMDDVHPLQLIDSDGTSGADRMASLPRPQPEDDTVIMSIEKPYAAFSEGSGGVGFED